MMTKTTLSDAASAYEIPRSGLAGEEKANRNSAQFKIPAKAFESNTYVISNRNKTGISGNVAGSEANRGGN
jgi:hypothetical protein